MTHSEIRRSFNISIVAVALALVGCMETTGQGTAATTGSSEADPGRSSGLPLASVTHGAVERTWEQAYVYLPEKFNPFGTGVLGGRRGLASIEQALKAVQPGSAPPVVIYLHGCGGFGNSGSTNAGMLAEAGFVVFGPDSFARPDRVRTCDGKRKVGIGPKGIYRQVIGMRITELNRALKGLNDFPWVNRRTLYLFGHSQGGNAVAAYTGDAFRARVMTGTRCSAGYHAPVSEPALVVSSANDPWFRGRPVKCLDYVGRTGLNVTILEGDAHVVARVPEGKVRILSFLKQVRTQ